MTLNRTNGTFELIGFLFTAAVLLGSIGIWVFVPQLERYRTADGGRAAAVTETIKLRQAYDRLYTLKTRMTPEIDAFEERFAAEADRETLLAWLATYLQAPMVTPGKRPGVFNVTGVIATPKKFYACVEALESAPWVFSTELPIQMHQSDKGGIFIAFALHRAATLSEPVQTGLAE